jgi:class 3 adenylate cyclase/tetratricopeptide (TPR) repeat protein
VTFEEMLAQVVEVLRHERRVSYRALRRRFSLDEEYLEDLKIEIIQAKQLAIDEDNTILVWSGEDTPTSASAPEHSPLIDTPAHLSEKILTSRTALEGERKQVTVLFADIKGSTELIAGLDPEEARTLLDPALRLMMHAVHRYEGTVNQVLGDGIMALFGAPLAHEDHAVRACYAALAMQEAMRRYTEEVRHTHGVEMQLRVGLNSGAVVVRAIGDDLHMDYAAVGQTTHLAARMEQLAPPGSIRLTADTLRLAEGFIQGTPLGLVPVKGLAEPVAVWELVGVTTLRRRLQAAVARGLSPFVGRQPELETLFQALERAGAGQGQVVALLGDPGVGKSRLVYEFLHAHRTQGWLRLESSSVSYGKATAYLPVCDLLKAYCHLDDRDDLRTVRAKVTGHILTLDAALQDTVPAVLALFEALPDDSPFLRLDPLQRRRRTLEALKRVLWRESQVQPLLLIFEDLHWIDSETQAVLDLLVESLPTARVLLLVNYRPEYQHGWGSKTYYTQLRLDPLPPASAEAVLDALLGDGTGAQHAAPLQALKQLLIARTEGNPFFLEESVRSLVETEVPWLLLRAIADISDEALYRSLTHLQAAELLYETSLFPEPAYTFKHALTHEVAYGSLLHERRRTLHARIVEALETLAGERRDDQVERLAQHALRGEVWDKALTYGRQAGDKAQTRSAYREAVVCFEQALAALEYVPVSRATTEQAIDLRLGLRVVLNALGKAPGQLLDHLRHAETLAQTLDDHLRLGLVYVTISTHCWVAGELDCAIDYGQRALALSAPRGHVGLQARVHLSLGRAYYDAGDYPRAVEHLGRSVATLQGDLRYESFGTNGSVAVTSLTWLSCCLAEHGVFTEGLAMAEEGLRIAETVKYPFSLIEACYGVGMVYRRQGEVQRAIPVLERAMTLCQDWHIPLFVPWHAVALGIVYAQAGHVAAGLALVEQGVEQEAASDRPRRLAPSIAQLSEAYLLVDRLQDARQRAAQALDLARQYKQRGNQAWALWLLGESTAHQASPEVETAADHYRQALALAEELGMRPLQAHCHRGLGTLYAQTGQQEKARAALAIAIDLYRAMAMTFWLPQAEAALAQVESVP